jgi:arylsulfatase A-like enzyme/Flp pilus assembly protein TadD
MLMRFIDRSPALILALALSVEPAAGTVRRDLNVLLITIDTVRADRLGCYGYAGAGTPNLDRLAAEGVRFANVYAQVPLTLPSHCSIMTGTYPVDHFVHNNGAYSLGPDLPTLAALLKGEGFKTAAFVASFTLDSRFGLARGFDLYDDNVQGGEALKSFRSERDAGAVLAALTPWLEENSGERFFGWAHFFDPHLPYAPPPPFDVEYRNRKYDGEIAYVDHVIGRLLEQLKDKGLLDRTLIVVAGDHGEALGEKKEIDHGLFLYDGTLRVPLIVRSGKDLPAGLVVPSRVRLIDIMPTILAILGMPVPPGVRGTSLLPYVRGRIKADLPSYIETYYPRENYGWSELRGLIDGPWKYILAPTPELYDLARDPREEKNLASAEPAILREKAGKFDALIDRSGAGKGAVRRTLTAAEVERLRSLGYLGGGRADDAMKKGLPDPKDKMSDYLLIFRGNLLENEGKLAQAAECYRQVLDANPDVPSNYVNLALLDMKMDREEEATRLLERARSKFPDSEVVLSRLMGLHLKAGRWQDALSVGRALLRSDPSHFDALFLSGSAHARLGQWEDALACYRKALAIEPENPALRRRHADSLHAYAVLLGKNGNFKDAIPLMRRYLEAAPRDDTARRDEARRLLEEWGRALKPL